MTRTVNGQEVEWKADATPVVRGYDRLYVRTAEGTFSAQAIRQGEKTLVSYRGRTYEIDKSARVARKMTGVSDGELRAPMPGTIIEVCAAPGQTVDKGDKVVVLEAMKTQQSLVAPFPGLVEAVSVTVGQQVHEAMVLAVVRPQETA